VEKLPERAYMKKLIIAGCGFGGLKLARKLNNHPGFDITLIDRFNFHQFQPLFYQVATGGLDASNISFPLRKAFQKSKNIRIRVCTLQQINTETNTLTTDIGEMEYDYLVIATGADTNFFNNQHLAENAFPMKSTVEALQLRHRLIENFEEALQAKDEASVKKLMTVVIAGAGPTGVELSGAIAEMRRSVLPKDYPELDFANMQIHLLEGTGKTLGAMSEKSSAHSLKYLNKLGVTVWLNTMLKDYDGEKVYLQNGETIPSALLIWAAGIKGNIPGGVNKNLIAKGNRIIVNRSNQVNGFENVFAIGDVCYMETPKYPGGHPQVAQTAMQQAALLAENLKRLERKNPHLYEFEYADKGSMATVGRHLAVVDMAKPKWHVSGWMAWMIWMGLHLLLILGVKNRVQVFINWIYKYITYDQNLRLVFKEFYRRKRKEQ
jgi:NADH:ubiquinone reductase (H+-translocating)